MPITGTQIGGNSKFLVTWNGAMQAGQVTSWTSSDPNAVPTIDPSDPTGNTVDVTDASTDNDTSYTLTATGTNSVGAQVTATAVVPLLPAPPAPATGGTIDQIS